MQVALMHLSGPNRDQMKVFGEWVIRLGTDPANDLAVEQGLSPTPGAFQAEIRHHGGSFLLIDTTDAGLRAKE